MLFNSLSYAIFFPVVAGLYFAMPYHWRKYWILAASCCFYMYFVPKYILILAAVILIDYAAGIMIERSSGRRRKSLLIVSLIANVGILGVFKYFNFFNSNVAALAGFLHWNYPIENLSLILPIGLSFHTFQSLSYTIEVYRGHQKAERHLGVYALYVMYFPQLVAGPIERPQNLLHQLRARHDFDYRRAVDGLKWMLWGLVKKAVIADSLAKFVNLVYKSPAGRSGPDLVLATVFFSIQIYCDFSGYSDMAIGSSKFLGIDLMENFRAPYFSRSIPEFWRRWHISLSTWFKDYLFVPLGGSRVSGVLRLRNLLIVFLVSGLWHGASWNFVIWGGLHALFMIGSVSLSGARARASSTLRLDAIPVVPAAVQTLFTFSLVTFSWVFFRAASLTDALHVVRGFGQGWARGLDWPALIELFGSPRRLYALLIVSGALLASEAQPWPRQPIFAARRLPLPARWAVYSAFCWLLLWFGVFGESSFIYFQF
jgi:alginate O-acetyltransferase complex protein AlgI